MSALEPDGPGRYVYPHAREAVRSWWVHRHGPGIAGGSHDGIRGHRAQVGDALRVGRVLSELGLRIEPPCDRLKTLVLWSAGSVPRSTCESLAKRVERHLRAAGVVAPYRPRHLIYRGKWHDSEGGERETTSLVEIPARMLDNVSE